MSTLTKDAIFQHIVQTLQQHFELDPAKIQLDSRLYEDLDIDSIDAVDLMVLLKSLTPKRLQPEAFKSVRTIGDVVDALHQLANAD